MKKIAFKKQPIFLLNGEVIIWQSSSDSFWLKSSEDYSNVKVVEAGKDYIYELIYLFNISNN